MGGPIGGIKENGTDQSQGGGRKRKTPQEEDKENGKGKGLTTKVNPDVHPIIEKLMAPVLKDRKRVPLYDIAKELHPSGRVSRRPQYPDDPMA